MEGLATSEMLFGSRLESEVFEAWREYYINYNHLKKLLKEGVILQNTWSEKDEQNFVSALDQELEKVYSFVTDKYDEIDDTLDKLQLQTENSTQKFDVDQFSTKLEDTLHVAQELEKFQRMNYTGFIKIVKKHDRVHPQYSVRPLLNVRLSLLPFHSEDYSPLLYKVSALFQFLRDNYSLNESLSKLSSFNDESQQDYKSFKLWIHPDNLMEVKATILRHLPVLIYDNKKSADDYFFDDENESSNDPKINCLYFDNSNFDLYNNKLAKTPNSCSLRIKWIGSLQDKPKITIERKSFNSSDQEYDVDKKLTIKEKYLDSFITGKFLKEKLVKKMEKNGDQSETITEFTENISSLTKFIKDNNLQPCMRTVYKRTAFQIPGDDRVRVVIDSDLMFIREDAFDELRPIRDPAKWHRTDIDSNIKNPLSFLRKGEYSKFPFSVMEVKVKVNNKNKRFLWLDELVNSHLVKEVPNFSKFIQGVASLFLEDDKLSNIPMWYNDIEAGIVKDPQQAFLELQKLQIKKQKDEDNMTKFRSMLANSSKDIFSSKSKSFSESFPPEPEVVVDSELLGNSLEQNKLIINLNKAANAKNNLDDLDVSSDEFENEARPKSTFNKMSSVFKIAKLVDADSEGEEIDLPEGVTKPEFYIKNSGPLKIEPKVWLANERTFNSWLHIMTLLSTLTFVIYSSANNANFPVLSNVLAYIYFFLTIFAGVWAYYVFNRRSEIIKERSGKHLDNIWGPLVIAIGLTAALVINFVLGFLKLAYVELSQVEIYNLKPNTLSEFYKENALHKHIHDFIFRMIGN